ncbi:hypothetical protein ACFLT9_01650 [Acidobacteriota bacterium]
MACLIPVAMSLAYLRGYSLFLRKKTEQPDRKEMLDWNYTAPLNPVKG